MLNGKDVWDRGATSASQADRLALEGLRPTTLVLGGLCLVLSLVYFMEFLTLGFVYLAAAVGFLGVSWFLNRQGMRHVEGRILSGVVAGLALIVSSVHFALMREPCQTANFMLLLVGAGFLALSTHWLILFMAVTGVVWSVIAWPMRTLSLWPYLVAGLLSSAALGLIFHFTRLRTYRRLAALRQAAESRASALQKRALHLEMLTSVGRSINSFLDLNALLDHIVELLSTRFGYEYVGIFLTDESGKYLISRAGTGEAGERLTSEGHRIQVGGAGLVGWASLHRELVCVNDVEQDERYRKDDLLPDTRSELVVPLEANGVLLGILDVQSTQLNAFTDEDVSVCSALADQIATAIKNASMYELEHSRRLISETLYKVGRALPQTLDIAEVLDLILTSLGQIISFDRGAVLLKRGNLLHVVAACGFPPSSNPLDIKVPIKPGDVFDQICVSKEPLAVREISDSLGWEYVNGLPPAHSWLGLPLVNTEDKVVGMLSLVREKLAPYSEDEIALGAAFAGQAAAALHNARLYRELSQAYRQLEHLDRAKSDFISLASHELRTPLTLITGYSYMLQDEPAIRDDPLMMTMVEGLVLGAARLQTIVDRMMDLVEIESESLQLNLEPVALQQLLEGVIASCAEAKALRELDIVLGDLSSCPEIEADRSALYKLFRNLVVNAIKYTPDGGRIEITGLLLTSGRDQLAEPCVEVAITDTGIGIDAQHQEQIFDKFYQTGEISLHSSGMYKFRGGGPGLGLAIVKGIVEAHRGRIWVESPGYDAEACPGSSFHVVLPVRQPDFKKELSTKLLRLKLGHLWSSNAPSVEDTIQFLMNNRKSS